MENRVREIRQEQGLTLEQLARQADTIASTIEKLEKGRRRLDIGWMRRLAKALGVFPADLLVNADNPHRLRNENEAALLDIFRRLKPENQARVISRTHLLWRAQEGLITEAEMEPNVAALLEPPAQPRPRRDKKPRKTPLPSEHNE